MLRILGRSHLMNGEVEPGGRALEGAVETALEHDPVLAVQPLLDHSLSAWLAGGPGQAFPLAVGARVLAEGAEPAVRDRAQAACAHLALVRGDPAAIEEAWDAIASSIEKVDFSQVPPSKREFTKKNFVKAREELVKELQWVGNVRSYLTSLASPVSDSH